MFSITMERTCQSVVVGWLVGLCEWIVWMDVSVRRSVGRSVGGYGVSLSTTTSARQQEGSRIEESIQKPRRRQQTDA